MLILAWVPLPLPDLVQGKMLYPMVTSLCRFPSSSSSYEHHRLLPGPLQSTSHYQVQFFIYKEVFPTWAGALSVPTLLSSAQSWNVLS